MRPIVQGSDTQISNNPWEWRIPVMRTLYASAISGEDIPDPFLDPWYCTVTPKNFERITCHVCEGGHHVHIVWPLRRRYDH